MEKLRNTAEENVSRKSQNDIDLYTEFKINRKLQIPQETVIDRLERRS